MDLRFKNGKFIIMQVSDAQDMQVVRKTMFHMLNVAYDTILPDLVVLTGDNILGNHLCDGRYRNNVYPSRDAQEKNMRKAINHLVAPIAKRGIPFAMVYGNHDDMNPLTKRRTGRDLPRLSGLCRSRRQRIGRRRHLQRADLFRRRQPCCLQPLADGYGMDR